MNLFYSMFPCLYDWKHFFWLTEYEFAWFVLYWEWKLYSSWLNMNMHCLCWLRPKKKLSHIPTLISMWTLFYCIALCTQHIFFFFFFFWLTGKKKLNDWRQPPPKKIEWAKNTIKKKSCIWHCSFSKKKKKKKKCISHSTFAKCMRNLFFSFFAYK